MDSFFFLDTCIIGARLKKVLYVGIRYFNYSLLLELVIGLLC
jgi:hypothetical protein